MTAAQYIAALKKLGLTPYGAPTREALGMSRRQLARYAAGDAEVPEPVARLLRLMLTTAEIDD